jgi:hypothetical protein
MAGRKDRDFGMGVSSKWVRVDPQIPDENLPGTIVPEARILPPGTHVLAPSTMPDSARTSSTPISLLPASDPVAGTVRVPGGPNWTTVCDYRTADGVPRRGTVIVSPAQIHGNTPPGLSFSTVQGVYVRITYGTERGRVSQIVGSPCEIPVEGSTVKVECMIGDSPYQLGFAGAVSVSSFSSDFNCKVVAMVVDGWTSPAQPIVLARDVVCSNSLVPQLKLAGIKNGIPAIIDYILLTNKNAADTILMEVMDSITGGAGTDVAQVYVPSTSTVRIGSSMLGAFFNGVSIQSVAADPNDANVIATIGGRYLLPAGQ